jgi:hypothetical protein
VEVRARAWLALDPEQVFADGRVMRAAAMDLPRDGVDVAQAPLENIAGSTPERAIDLNGGARDSIQIVNRTLIY